MNKLKMANDAYRTSENYRHPLLALCLGLILSGSILLAGLFAVAAWHQMQIGTQHAFIINVVGFLYLANIACLIGVIRWRKMGYYGLWVVATLLLIIQLIFKSAPMTALMIYLPVIFITLALQLGSENKGWKKLH